MIISWWPQYLFDKCYDWKHFDNADAVTVNEFHTNGLPIIVSIGITTLTIYDGDIIRNITYVNESCPINMPQVLFDMIASTLKGLNKIPALKVSYAFT